MNWGELRHHPRPCVLHIRVWCLLKELLPEVLRLALCPFASCSLPLSWVHIELVALTFLLCLVPTEEAGVGPVTLGFFKNSGRVEGEVVSGSWMARWSPQAVVATPVLSKYLWNSWGRQRQWAHRDPYLGGELLEIDIPSFVLAADETSLHHMLSVTLSAG